MVEGPRKYVESRGKLPPDVVRAAKEQFRRSFEAKAGRGVPTSNFSGGEIDSQGDAPTTEAVRTELFRRYPEAAKAQTAPEVQGLEGKTPVRYFRTEESNRLEIGGHMIGFDVDIKSPDELVGVAARNLAKGLCSEGLNADEIYAIVGPQVDQWRQEDLGQRGAETAVAVVQHMLDQRKAGAGVYKTKQYLAGEDLFRL